MGGCELSGVKGIRWAQLRAAGSKVQLQVFESRDFGSEELADVYEFGPLDPDLEFEDANEVLDFEDIDTCLRTLEERWAGASNRLTNEFLVQDEYLDYLRRGKNV